jgi:hypothetical protein
MELAFKFNFLLMFGVFFIFIEFVDCEESYQTNYTYQPSGHGLLTVGLLIILLIRCCKFCCGDNKRAANVASDAGEWKLTDLPLSEFLADFWFGEKYSDCFYQILNFSSSNGRCIRASGKLNFQSGI